MKKSAALHWLGTLMLGITLLGCQSTRQSAAERDVLFQYATLSGLMAGGFDGEMTYAELKQHGDFGVGTFIGVDGEMIQVDHQVYQVKADGKAYPVAGETKTPFAVVTYFEPDHTLALDQVMDCEALKTEIDHRLPTEDLPYAIKVEGTFAYMKTRSVPPQKKPYPPLAEVLKTQPTFEFQEVEGTMVGFRLPAYMDGANAPGYHFHFITAERDAGGHVLACQAQDVQVAIDYTDKWYTVLPTDTL